MRGPWGGVLPLIAALGLGALAGGGLRADGQPLLSTILTNGPLSNRLNMVVLSEGYTSNQSGLFLAAATNSVTALLSWPPYREYSGYFNAFAIFVASRQAGSTHVTSGVKRDTYFGSAYDPADRLITMPPAGQAKVDALLKALLPRCRLPILLVNDPVPGGSDGFDKTAIASTSAGLVPEEALIILTHETGHVLANLGDEYTTPNPGFPNTEEPNTTREMRPGFIKWSVWIAPGTPLPTPPTSDYAEVVGLFQGAHYHTNGWYRPKLNCMMGSFGSPFCEVCSEALVRAIYQSVRPVDSFSPGGLSLAVPAGQGVDFSLDLLQPATHDLSVQWQADGQPVSGATNLSLSLPPGLGPGGHFISALVQDRTGLVRTDPAGLLTQKLSWSINGGFSNAVQSVLLTLTATIQGPANAAGSTVFRAALANKDILKALAQAAPNGGFSSAAKLLLVTPSNTGASRFVVRDILSGTNRDTDISSWFTNSVLASVPNPASASRTQYALERLVLTSDLLSLDSQALAAISWPGAAATATLLGAGSVTNAPALFQGTLTLSPAKFEKPR